MSKKLLQFMATLLLSSLYSNVVFSNHMSEKSIKDRTKPAAQVYVAGENAPPKVEIKQAASDGPRTGEQIYNSTCQMCHASGMANAPKFGDAEAWAPLAARGIDDLLASAIKGKGVMPPKGSCSNCSDEELKNTIQYMLNNSQ